MYIRALFKQEARRHLSGQYPNAMATAFLALLMPLIIFCTAATPALLSVALLIMGPLLLAISQYFLEVASQKRPTVMDFFDAFNRSLSASLAYLWQCLWTLLWLLAFIVPGVIKWLSYSMQMFLLADEPTLDGRRALTLSKQLTEGYKWELFVTHLSFAGWALLALATGGLALVYILPYYYTTMAVIYRYLKEQALISGRVTAADFPSSQRQKPPLHPTPTPPSTTSPDQEVLVSATSASDTSTPSPVIHPADINDVTLTPLAPTDSFTNACQMSSEESAVPDSSQGQAEIVQRPPEIAPEEESHHEQ